MGTGEQGTNGSISLGEESASGTEVFDQVSARRSQISLSESELKC